MARSLATSSLNSTVERMRRNEQHAMRGTKSVTIHGFCAMVHKSLTRYHLMPHFTLDSDLSKHQWKTIMEDAIATQETSIWMDSMWMREDSTNMESYRAMKTTWGEEAYLTCADGKVASPLCIHCQLARPENQQHILCDCPMYESLRDKLDKSAAIEWNRMMASDWEHTTSEERTWWLLSWPPMYRDVGDYLVDAFQLKARVESASASAMDRDASDASHAHD